MNEHEHHCKAELMSQILDVRYTNLNEERVHCLELLAWAEEADDLYGEAFAHAFLGDFYLTQNEGEQAFTHLYKAKRLLGDRDTYPELWLRLLCFLAICYQMQANEALSIQHYMEAIVLAKHIGDPLTEVLVCNNVALTFQKHNGLEEALWYFKQAYELLDQVRVDDIKVALLSNLVEVNIMLERFDDALGFIEECSAMVADTALEKEELMIRNWCCYYGAKGNKEEAVAWAKKALSYRGRYDDNQFSEFDNLHVFFRTMVQIGHQQLAKDFLGQQETMKQGLGLEQRFVLEKNRLEYCLLFEPPQMHLKAYRRLYKESVQIRNSGNKVIVNAMRGRLELEDALSRRDRLIKEHESLSKQANIDELSGLYNRGYLNRLLRDSRFEGKVMGTIMLDIDYFKEYNDFYGHMKGDRVIIAVGESLMENEEDGIFACRYGGDEFACVLCDVDPSAVEHYIEKVQKSLEMKAIPHEKSLCNSAVTLSIGYAVARLEKNETLYYLLQNADAALYRTKLSGRNGYCGETIGES